MTHSSNIVTNDDMILDICVANNIASKYIKQVTIHSLERDQQVQLEILRYTFHTL